MKRVLIALVFLACVAGFVFADGSIAQNDGFPAGSIQRIELTWTSLTNYTSGATTWLNGTLKRVTLKPTAGNTSDYTVTLKDQYGVDLLAGEGSSVSSNGTVDLCPGLKIRDGDSTTNLVYFVFDCELSVMATNTGVGSGQIILYIEK